MAPQLRGKVEQDKLFPGACAPSVNQITDSERADPDGGGDRNSGYPRRGAELERIMVKWFSGDILGVGHALKSFD